MPIYEMVTASFYLIKPSNRHISNSKSGLPMVFKLIAKLLFKATIPFAIIAGLISYGVHSKGGDPMAMWKGFGSGITDQLAGMYSKARDGASNVANAVADKVDVGPVDAIAAKVGGSKRTKVFTWKDANGVTQYSNIAPNDVESRIMSVNPNMNVMAPVLAPKPIEVSSNESEEEIEEGSQNVLSPSASRNDRKKDKKKEYGDPAVQEVADQLGGDLPGVLGQIMSTQGGENAGGLNPTQLIKILQQ